MGLFKRAGRGVAADGASKERRTRRRQSCVFVAGVLFFPGLLILGGVVSAIYGMTVQWELDALEASIRANGEPVTEVELEAYLKQVCGARPAIQRYREALGQVAGLHGEGRPDPGVDRFFPHSVESFLEKGRFPNHDLVKACEYLEERRSVFDALAKVNELSGDMPEGDVLDDFTFGTLRHLEQAIWTRGFMALHERDWESFFDAQEQLLELSNNLEPVLHPIPAVRHAIGLLHSAISTGEVPATYYERMSARYSRVDTQASLRAWLTSHRVAVSETLRGYYAGDKVDHRFGAYVPLRTWCYRRLRNLPGYRSISTHDVLWQTRYVTAVLEDHGTPWHARYANMVARQPFDLGRDMPGDGVHPWHSRFLNVFARILYPQVDDSWWERRSIRVDGTLARTPLTVGDTIELIRHPEKHVRGNSIGNLLFDVQDPTESHIALEFRLRSVRLAMLIDAHRQQTGALPDSLDALDPLAVAAIGGDPYVDGPLGYRVVVGGFLVYSVGPDLVDNGGEYLGLDKGDLVEQFVKEKPVESIDDSRGRGRDVQPTRPSRTLGPLKPKVIAE